MDATRLYVTEIDSPAGAIVFARRGERLVALSFKDHLPRMKDELTKRFGAVGSTPLYRLAAFCFRAPWPRRRDELTRRSAPLELTPDANGGPAGRALRRY